MGNKLGLIKNGIVDENPTLRLVLGTCPTLALTTSVSTAVGMGAAATFVLICSNMAISALRKVIPDKVRIPAFITVIAGFVSIIEMLMKAFVPSLYEALGVYLPLIVVNCIILGRAEMFACKNKVLPSILDGAGMGLGFTLSLFTMGSIREILGTGAWMGIDLPGSIQPMTMFIMPAGGFFVLGCVIAMVNKIAHKKPPVSIVCAGCPNAAACGAQKGGCEE